MQESSPVPSSLASRPFFKSPVWGHRFWQWMICTLLVVLAIGFGSQPATATAKHYNELPLPPLPEVQVPKYDRYTLANGVTVYLVEDHELPLVSGLALFWTGERFEPAAQVGLATLTGEVMRMGGTQHHPAEVLNQLLEQRAAAVETSIGSTSGSASFNALSEDLETVFGLFAEVIQEPAFDQAQLDLAKTQIKGEIARRNDDPSDIANREFLKLLYGSSSPYARTVEYKTLSAIDRRDIIQFYQRSFRPEQTILGILGDFDSVKMRALIEEHFSHWQPPKTVAAIGRSLPTVKQAQRSGVFLIDQPQMTQSFVQMGHLGGTYRSPDYPALGVLNNLLAGSSGRLQNEIRSRQGLAYSVYALWSPAFDYPGLFIAGGQTRSNATLQFIQSLQSELKRLQTQPISQAELAYAKDSELNSFVFNFEDPGQTLSRLMRYAYFGYPDDTLFRYQRGVNATTVADIQRVAQTYFQTNDLVTLVVGNGQEIAPGLKTLAPQGLVTPIDITIPPA